MDELSRVMKEFVEVKGQIKELNERSDELRTELLLLLKTNDLDKYEDDENEIIYTLNKRNSFDKHKALTFISEKGGDVDTFFTESEFEMLKVRAKGGQK